MTWRGAASLGLLAAWVGVAAPAEAQWRRLDSPDFVVIGDASPSALRDVTVKFEGFRDVLRHLLGERAVATAVPTVVVVFQSERAMAPFRPRYQGKPVDVAGLFVPGRDVNHIALVDDGNPERLHVILHEYFHLITSNAGQPLPVWLNEGLAEFYSTFDLWRGGREAEVGRAVREHLALLQDRMLIPLVELLAADHDSSLYNEGNRRSVFYAQAWALTHMLLSGETSRTPQLTAYLGRVSSGIPAGQAWTEAFGDGDVMRELERYVRRSSFQTTRISIGEAAKRAEGKPATMAPADVQMFLADLLIAMKEYDDAAGRIAEAARLEPGNTRLPLSRAVLDLARGQLEDAAGSLATVSRPEDWYIAYRAGAAGAELIAKRGGAVPSPELASIRQQFASASEGHQAFPNAAARLASIELRTEPGPSAATAVALEEARTRAPGRYDYAFLYAQVLTRQREFDRARAVLGPFMTSAYAPNVRAAARDLMGFIVGVEQAINAGEPPPAPPSSVSGDGSDRTSSSTGGVRPVFRELQPGESRMEGILERIECVESKGIVFHLRVGGKVETASAPTLSTVDFITYRDDLRGGVTCGPFMPPMPVYLTWKADPEAPGAKLTVAIEFLPRQKAVQRSTRLTSTVEGHAVTIDEMKESFASPGEQMDRRFGLLVTVELANVGAMAAVLTAFTGR